jgi:hypothetical protein
MDKSKLRARLASLSFSEKIKILEKLRDRDHAIAASGLRRKAELSTCKKADKGHQSQSGDLERSGR